MGGALTRRVTNFVETAILLAYVLISVNLLWSTLAILYLIYAILRRMQDERFTSIVLRMQGRVKSMSVFWEFFKRENMLSSF